MRSPQPRPSWPERLPPLLGAALGLCWFLAAGGARALPPTHLDWLGAGDLGQHVLGWLLFRNEPLRLPLGAVSSLYYPLGTSVAYTDANPWVALLLKPFSSALPQDFQYIGVWLALCFTLQGFFGAKVMETLTPSRVQRVLGAALFVMAPVLLFRLGHDTLCAHWLLLGMLWLHLRPVPDEATARRLVGWAVAFNLLAAGFHPYLSVMVFLPTLALGAKLYWVDRKLSRLALLGVPAALGVALGAIFWLFGYVGQPVSLGAGGFGHYSSDLTAFFNSMGTSRWLPGLPTGVGQYEGFGYLGAGVLALGVGAVVAWRLRPPREPLSWRPVLPLLVVAVGLFLFALSTKMTVAGHTFFSVRKLVQPVEPMLAPLRSSGRFIWVPYYVLLAGVLALTLRTWRARPAVATGLLLAAVAVQLADARSIWERVYFHEAKWPRLSASEWSLAAAPYRHLVMYPPYTSNTMAHCGDVEYPFEVYLGFADLAYRQRLTLNSGYTARVDDKRLEAACDALKADVEAGRFARDTVYVVHPTQLARFTRPDSGVTCGPLEGFTVCVSAAQATPLRDALSGTPAVAGDTGN